MYEQADGGTLFLDEIGELPLSQQAKLLRVLESGQYRRVGGRKPRRANVRVVCATNRHLWDQVKAGRFREDLYYRIACLAVRLPPLRERIDDIQLLVPSLLDPISKSMSRCFYLNDDALDQLRQYDYPGNVRELRNILFITATHSKSNEIMAEVVAEVMQMHLQSRKAKLGQSRDVETTVTTVDTVPAANAEVSLDAVEAGHISRLLEKHHNNRRQVAEALQISERTLYRKLKKYRLG
jgi:two-component system response regulator AtoC